MGAVFELGGRVTTLGEFPQPLQLLGLVELGAKTFHKSKAYTEK